MNAKVLFIATVDKGHILKFHVPYLKYFKERGYEVHVACAGNEKIPYCDKRYNISFERSPIKFKNIRAYKELKKVVNQQHYSIIHCHTPVGGVIGRLASKKTRRKGTNVLYTAHGFHFYNGAPFRNWLLYYPIEKWLSRYTDCLITINEEDYQNALYYKFKSKFIKKVNGVGVDLSRFSPLQIKEKNILREKYGYKHNEFILLYTADLNYNKHQDLIINALNILKTKIPNIRILFAGEGPYLDVYKELSTKLCLNDKVEFLGFRKDIPNLLKLSDVAISASRREGLPVNLLEAMATGLPIIATNCRGNRDLVNNGENGYIVGVNDVQGFAEAVMKLYSSKEIQKKFAKKNLNMVDAYSLNHVMIEMNKIYRLF